jgi:hypothetical protein
VIGQLVESEKTTVRLIGGLGNQLFIYFAGLYLSRKSSAQLVCDLSYLDTDKTKHGVSITSFGLEGRFIRKPKWVVKTISKWSRLTSYSCRRSKKFNKLYEKISNTYVSKAIGYDHCLENIRADRTILGYFQTWKYVRALENDFDLDLKIRNPSEWFTQLSSVAEREHPVIIHVRHGDYFQDQNAFIGILGPNYYKSAISEVRAVGVSSPLWVFSNDIESAKRHLSPHVGTDVSWVVSPEGTDPAEELALMQFGGAHIIANSTFSWWGAYLSRSTKIVIAPRSWFKNQTEPLDLIPPDWRRIENDWI